ncbi:hypothetical protein [Dietzia sp. CQ4]|uniref:hypothetical protein n=1 Tax=Dietzia sp. (strain CQ4) TaxID=370437 RepID=UPI0015FDCA90|nr:hypothetical protein [Dietzia sp. CQ4]
MDRQLTIVVACTDRKSLGPRDELRARSLRAAPLESRVQDWVTRLEVPDRTTRLVDLYQGEAWTQAKRLFATTRRIGYEPNVFVASAGLGLKNLNDQAPAYSATFTPRHPDSVAHTDTDARLWWKNLPHADVPRGGSAVWVLSDNYARAAGVDLIERTEPSQLLVFGGAANIPLENRVPADRQLRHALGGTLTSLNVRSASKWMELTTAVGAFSEDAHGLWREWTDESRKLEQHNRTAVPDKAILELIATLRSHDPKISKTHALASLRKSGIACEQRRFSGLFHKAVGS